VKPFYLQYQTVLPFKRNLCRYVKVQSIKTAVESAAMLLRIDDIVSGLSQKTANNPGAGTGGEVLIKTVLPIK
jgi:hypothetical protein